ncbi:DUF4468 domain-containing protein [Chitinophaga sp. Ak27]|uniref:DUF4468 domain-containing protein n=1 Tax=Chitinophaga sp. Ak27 TaxID=2726116 RepID=UPI00145F0962|nr:DUF4468 domain-containing protein [Chitinophaga sp. Ak27]NLU92554.1 DUF4468 domain-containing protein [Chitinophaga sp. Ak27]
MKKFILFFFFLPFAAFGQSNSPDSYLGELPIRNGRINYTGIDSISGVSKDELYLRAKAFLSTAFPNFKDVVKLDDKDLGKITVRGIFRTDAKGGNLIKTYQEFYANTNIQVKDGKFRYEITDFVKPSSDLRVPDFNYEQMLFNKKRAEKLSPDINALINRYIVALIHAMKSQDNF